MKSWLRGGWRLLAAAAILALGLIVGGYLLGNGLLRARLADRSIEVKGLAERDVRADLATWTIAYTATGYELGPVQNKIDDDTQAITAFLRGFGFGPDEIANAGVNVNQWINANQPEDRRTNITIRQTMRLRTAKVADAARAYAAQSDLVRKGVVLEADRGDPMVYSFTRLNEVKPAMIAQATRNAREGAEQFAKDSGASVGGIKSASQGYFSILPRDGDASGPATASPDQKVRVVTTINFYIDG